MPDAAPDPRPVETVFPPAAVEADADATERAASDPEAPAEPPEVVRTKAEANRRRTAGDR